MIFLLSLIYNKAKAALDLKSILSRSGDTVLQLKVRRVDVCIGQLHTDHSLVRLGTKR